MGLSRRDLMKKAGMMAVGTGFAGLSLSMANKAIGAGEEQQNKIPELPWPYKKLDPAVTAKPARAQARTKFMRPSPEMRFTVSLVSLLNLSA